MAEMMGSKNMKEKVKKALELLKERKVTIRKAAALASVSYWKMLDLMSKSGLDIGYTLKDLRRDIKLLSTKRQDAWSGVQKFPKRNIGPNQLAKDLEAVENG